MRRCLAVVFTVLATCSAASAADTKPPAFVLIVHSGVKATSITRADLNALYIKKLTRWPEDVAVVPYDQPVNAPVRAAFSERVFGKSPNAVLSEWRQRIFTGQGTPPRELRDDTTMIAAVAATPGAIGYVATGTQLPPTVHRLTITD